MFKMKVSLFHSKGPSHKNLRQKLTGIGLHTSIFFIDLFIVPTVIFSTVAVLLSISLDSDRINSICVYTHAYMRACVYTK